MTTAHFSHVLVFLFLFGTANVFSANDAIFKEAQEAVLGTLDLPLGISGQNSIHIRFQGPEKNNGKPAKPESPLTFEMWEDAPAKKSFGESGTYELWNPKLHLRLSESAPLSTAAKLNGNTQALWQGEAMLSGDAYRLLLNPDSINGGKLQYTPWETPPSKFGPNGCLGFSVIKTAEGWKVRAVRSPSRGGEPPYDKVIALSPVPASRPDSSCSEDEVKSAFSHLIGSRAGENLVLIERTLATAPSFINVDRYHEFHSPSLEFAVLPLTDAQALNGLVMASVRVNCEAHRFPKTVKSKTAQTPANLPQSISLWKGEDPGKTWNPGPTSKEKGDCDYIGIRKAGKWTFTTFDVLLNPIRIEQVVLLQKSEIPNPEDELPAKAEPSKRPQSGIGATLEPLGNVVEIKSLVAGGPAEKSGQLQIGDRILAIGIDDPPSIWSKIDLEETDDKNERAIQLSEVIKQIRGPAGTAVYLRVQPAGTNSPAQVKAVKIVRAEFNVK